MLLHVNEMGLVPDGRFLERASIAAESFALSDPDRNLRETDIGKNIAVPGALDLVTPIAALTGRKDVANASMDAGGATPDILTAPLPPGQGFRADLNLNQRITVAGAGPGGATLVSDVVQVINSNTLKLATSAATTVTGVAAILNRPDRVGLANHARADAGDVTVNLGDRTIVDASMVVGGRGLESPTAKFSSVDLGKIVTIPGAGLLVTTIQSFQSPAQVTLAQSAQRTVTGGLADVWKTDSRPAFEQLRAALDSSDVEGAEIQFGPGVYDFTAGPPQSGITAAIALHALKNLTLRGAGPGATVLRLMPNQDRSGPDTDVIHILDCKNLTIRDLSVHGAYLTLAGVNEQMHGIVIGAGSEETVVERVRVFQSSGDGIRLLGEPDRKVRKVWMNDCRLIQNKRTGIGFQRAVEFVWIRDCYIESKPPTTDDGMHFEPSGNQSPTDVVIEGNVFIHGTDTAAVSIAGINSTDPALRVKFINNTVQGGGILGFDAQDVTVADNTIVAGERGQVVLFRGACSGLRFCNNKIVAASGARTALRIASDANLTSSRVWIEANHIVTSGSGIELTGSSADIIITENVIEQVSTGVPGASIQLANAARVLISGNNVSASPAGPAIAMRGNSDDWRIVGNRFNPGSSVILAGAGSLIVNNVGYNPVGSIANPWPSTGTDLTNQVGSGSAVPQSGKVYTVRHTPKTVVIGGGAVSQIRINGADAGLTAGAYKLGVGETIAVNYTSPPGTLVFAE
jgi:hypothetical protein